MQEPNFAFTIPSLEDDLPLDCRIYLNSLPGYGRKGAVVAHPYAPLGGSQDDHVVLSVVDELLKEGFIVATFNFRGAGESLGKTSWTGRPEIEDYSSVVGFLVYYLRHLLDSDESKAVTSTLEISEGHTEAKSRNAVTPAIQLVLGGYSFGSLILARLCPVVKILERFETAERGSAAAEIVLRASTLARKTSKPRETRNSSTRRGRTLEVDGSSRRPHSQASPIIMGGDETDPSERRSSRDKRSLDVVREVPHRLRTHVRRLSGSSRREHEASRQGPTTTDYTQTIAFGIRYLLISPVLIPLTPHLLPPGLPFSLALPTNPNQDTSELSSGLLSLSSPALVLFGSSDNFTSSKRLRQWAERLERESSGVLRWTQIDGAGHFWREEGVMQALQGRITEWLGVPGRSSSSQL